MTQQTINVGTVPNDGTGDPARTAFQKVNSNFTELYVANALSVKAYGASGNGVNDDTAAITNALVAAQAAGRALYFPAGTYIVSTLQLPLLSYTQPFPIFGEGYGITKIQKKSADGLPLFIVGSATATTYSTQLWVQGITFSGVFGNTPAAVQLYDLVRSTFQQCVFQNSIAGLISLGGITNTYQNCIFQNNQIGVKFDKFTSLAGGGYPNNNEIKDCGIFNNSSQGIYFNNGRCLFVTDCDIETNGTSGNSATMGVYVANVNTENASASALGIVLSNCWLEKNAGDAALQTNSGVNTVRSCNFVANSNATNDIHVVGGNYHLSEVLFGTNKAANVLESAGSNVGNSIVNSFDALVGQFSINAAKTMVIGSWNNGTGTLTDTILMRSGSVPVVQVAGAALNNPLIQTGTATTSTGGAVSVTFSTAYPSTVTPQIFTTVGDASPGKCIGVQISSVTYTGFTITCTYLQSGSSTVSGLVGETITWLAIGATT